MHKFTKQQYRILDELCFSEYLQMCQLINNNYIDKKQVETRITQLKELLETLNDYTK